MAHASLLRRFDLSHAAAALPAAAHGGRGSERRGTAEVGGGEG